MNKPRNLLLSIMISLVFYAGCGEEQTRSLPSNKIESSPTQSYLSVYQQHSYVLDRINQRERPLDQNSEHKLTGKGVHVYILDGLPLNSHEEFLNRDKSKSRLMNVFSALQNNPDWRKFSNDHGTHVAALVGGQSYGVAPDVTLFGLDVLSAGTVDAYISAMEWVIKNHKKPAIINLSSSLKNKEPEKMVRIEKVVKEALQAGIVVVSSAGNSHENACLDVLPAKVPGVITVGSVNAYDQRAITSSFGRCVDLFAPGVAVPSAVNFSYGDFDENSGIGLKSGTSMATPLVSGAAALILEQNPEATPKQVRDILIKNSTKNLISGLPRDTPNRLLFIGDSSRAYQAPSVTEYCREKCTFTAEALLDTHNGGFYTTGTDGMELRSIVLQETQFLNRVLAMEPIAEIWLDVEGPHESVEALVEVLYDGTWHPVGPDSLQTKHLLKRGINTISLSGERFRVSLESLVETPVKVSLHIGYSQEVLMDYITN